MRERGRIRGYRGGIVTRKEMPLRVQYSAGRTVRSSGNIHTHFIMQGIYDSSYCNVKVSDEISPGPADNDVCSGVV